MSGYTRIEDVLAAAENLMQLVQLALDDFLQGDRQTRRTSGFWNVITLGRSVTIVLQHLRTFKPETFDAWYAPYKEEMERDLRFKYLVAMRNQMLKEGRVGRTRRSGILTNWSPGQLRPAMTNPPLGATSFFAIDKWGGSGWIVHMADGSQEKFYVDLPPDVQSGMEFETTFAESSEQKGAAVPAPTQPIDRLLTDYVAYLTKLVQAAQREFGHK
jgi:hypothetical protein